jgi:flagellar biosynthesis/type III secretory pathway M-ring protein FliF/YscJ
MGILMWSKIKTWLWGALVAIFTILITILGIKSRQLKKEKQKTDDLEQQIREDEAKDEFEDEAQEIADQEEEQTEQAMSEVKKEEVEQLVEVASGEKPPVQSYNDLVENWNNEKK